MRKAIYHASGWRPQEAVLIGLTLVASAVHFFDNALRPDLYPGPTWLSRDEVLCAWVLVLLTAAFAYWRNTRAVLVGYGLLGFGGLEHYLMPNTGRMPVRCLLTIGAEAAASILLIAYALTRPLPDAR